MRKIIAVCLFVIAGTSLALAAGDWSDAQDKFRKFEKEHKDLRRLTPRETRRIVDAICRADETERKDAAKTAGTRAKDKVADKYSDLEELKDDALKAGIGEIKLTFSPSPRCRRPGRRESPATGHSVRACGLHSMSRHGPRESELGLHADSWCSPEPRILYWTTPSRFVNCNTHHSLPLARYFPFLKVKMN